MPISPANPASVLEMTKHSTLVRAVRDAGEVGGLLGRTGGVHVAAEARVAHDERGHRA